MSLFHRFFSNIFDIANPLLGFVHMLKIVENWIKANCLNGCFIFYLINNTNFLEEMKAKEKEKEEKERKKIEQKKYKDLQKVKKAKRKKIEGFENDTDEDDEIVEEETEEEVGDEKEYDENEKETIHFEEEKNVQLSTEFLAMELYWKRLCPPNKEDIVGKWFAYIYDSKKVRIYILGEYIKDS